MPECKHLLLAPESIERGYCEACHLAAKPVNWPRDARWGGSRLIVNPVQAARIREGYGLAENPLWLIESPEIEEK